MQAATKLILPHASKSSDAKILLYSVSASDLNASAIPTLVDSTVQTVPTVADIAEKIGLAIANDTAAVP